MAWSWWRRKWHALRRPGASGRYSEDVSKAVGRASIVARQCGARAVQPIHLLLALLQDDAGEHLPALQEAGVNVSLTRSNLGRLLPMRKEIEPGAMPVGEPFRQLIAASTRLAQEAGVREADTPEVLRAMLETPEPAVASFLRSEGWPVGSVLTALKSLR